MNANKALLVVVLLCISETLSYAATDSWRQETCRAMSGEVEEAPVVESSGELYGSGRIIDITYRIREDMACWERKGEGLGQYLWLTHSMKNGSVANFSVMKLPTHTGTHVDAPGHVFDHYYDAGFDVDTLDLEVLNEGDFSLWKNIKDCCCSGKFSEFTAKLSQQKMQQYIEQSAQKNFQNLFLQRKALFLHSIYFDRNEAFLMTPKHSKRQSLNCRSLYY